MEYIKIIKVNKDILKRIDYYLNNEPKDINDEYLHEDETISRTSIFDNDIEMDIKCCGVKFDENSSNKAWTEAVLFKNGSEVACSEIKDNFIGEWEFKYDGNKYITKIVEGD